MRGWRASARAATMRSASGASPRVSLSGLPGVTSHHTRSRSSRFIASRQAARCASCGGSNVPPNRPIRIPGACGGSWTPDAAASLLARAGGEPRNGAPDDGVCSMRPKVSNPSPGPTLGSGPPSSASGEGCTVAWRGSRPDLSRAAHAILEAGELLDADRPARMEAAGGDPDLGAEAELAAVGELGRGVVQHNGGIDLAQELFGRALVLGDDGLGVVRAVALDMRDCTVDAVDHLGRDDGVEILGRPVLLAC